jgi:manganese transport protein
VLSIQLPFAIVPLVRLTSSRELMGSLSSRSWVRYAAVACATLVTVANVTLVLRTVQQLASSSPLLASVLFGLGGAGLGFLAWICWVPLRSQGAARLPAEGALSRG